MAVSVKEASRIAIEVVEDLFEDQSISNVLFEEVEKDPVGNWLITVGFDRKLENRFPLLGGSIGNVPRTERKYKVAKINGEGDLESLRDRLL